MDMSQYKQQFLSEVRDHLDIINESLLELEKNPDDKEVINKAFRSFHTIKGNAATMGFTIFSELAHGLEDVLGKVREDELSVNGDLMDVLFNGCDLLDEGLGLIEGDKSEELDITSEKKDIDNLLQKEEVVMETVDLQSKAKLSETAQKRADELKEQGKIVHRLIATFASSAGVLKGAKAGIILRELKGLEAEIIQTTPSEEELKKGNFTDDIELVFASNKEKATVEKAIEHISGIEKLSILTLDEEYAATKKKDSSQHDKKENEKHTIMNSHKDEITRQVQSVKVNISQLDNLMNRVGELLINNLQIQQISTRYQDKELLSVIDDIGRLTNELQEEIMEVRMVPIGNIFNRFPRMVRDLAKREKKKINFVIEGAEIEFDRTVLETIGEPLVHLLRNSIDHGIESPDARENEGKTPEGLIKLIARREKNHATIELLDDGAGIDEKRVRESSIKKGILSKEEADKLTPDEIRMLIFKPGLSTNEVVTDVSGRGVGMDVVETSIKQLGGTIKLHSEMGKGTTVILRLPLTVAIVTCLMIDVSSTLYAIPIASIERTVIIQKKDIKTINGKEVFILTEEDIPLVRLSDKFHLPPSQKTNDRLHVIVLDTGMSRVGIVVDKVVSQQQILIKSLDSMVKRVQGVGGATILGDGSVALIIDPATLIN